MPTLESSIAGLVYLPARDDSVPSGEGWLNGRRKIDGAENLWRIHNSLYDLTYFAKNHPGGSEWIELTKGTDITELFESHHITNKARKLLPKYYQREANGPRTCPMTFEEDGFFKKFQKRAAVALKNVDFHNPSPKSKIISDFLAIMTLLFCLLAVKTQSLITLPIAAFFLTSTTITGHNYFHMRDNFRMYYFDISLMSSKQWRITHAMSHHMYPNTIWDFEIYTLEPFLRYLPINKTKVEYFLSILLSPIVWFLSFYAQGLRRYISALFQAKLEFRDLIPFILPTLMYLLSKNFIVAFTTWIIIIGISSIIFQFIGLNAAHHHPDIFHDGDICRENLDWGLLEMDAVRDRKIIDDSIFLVLTNFGLHSLHHLLPTVDHSYLPLCLPAYQETCREFGVNLNSFTQIELIKGQFQQLGRNKPKLNIR